MKKLFAILLTIICAISLCFCGENGAKAPTDDTSVTDTKEADTAGSDMKKEASPVDEISLKDMMYLFIDMTDFSLDLSCNIVEDTDAGALIGNDEFNLPYEEAASLEPMMFPNAFALGVFRLSEGADADAFAAELETKANKMKWVCVGAEDVRTAVSGRTVFFVMSSKEKTEALTDCFNKMCGEDFIASEHIKIPFESMTMSDFYAELNKLYGADTYGILDNNDVQEFPDNLAFRFGDIDTSLFTDSVYDECHVPESDMNMESSYIIAAFRMAKGADGEKFAADLIEGFTVGDIRVLPYQAFTAYGNGVVFFFQSCGGYGYYEYDFKKLIKNRYRMEIVGVYYTDEEAG